jgi:hypothetical protein
VHDAVRHGVDFADGGVNRVNSLGASVARDEVKLQTRRPGIDDQNVQSGHTQSRTSG